MEKVYVLPQLGFEYKDLKPYISEEQLIIHHQKHHLAYINSANSVFEKLEKARKEGGETDAKAIAKELSFYIGGHKLHSLFWEILSPAGENGGGMPVGKLAEVINKGFNSFERFKKEFSQTALSLEGSGWAALFYDIETEKLIISQIEKHNVNFSPTLKILLVLDMWEHAYYLDYKNEKAKFVEAFWNIVNWKKINERFLL